MFCYALALADLEKCVNEGGLFKVKCSHDEKKVGGGCSNEYCCCAPLDSEYW